MSFYEITNEDKINKKSNVRQLVDILQVDIASYSEDANGNLVNENTRKKYEVFVTGGINNSAVTSSLFHTVFDQDHNLQTSNEMLDLTIGLYQSGSAVQMANWVEGVPQVDSAGKLIFSDNTLMMREKINMYKQYAQVLLGNSEKSFYSPFDSELESDRIDYGFFINFKRLFVRDGLDKEQFSIKISNVAGDSVNDGTGNINKISVDTDDYKLYSDANATQNLSVTSIGGQIGDIVDSNGNAVGLIFYDKGICIFNAEKIFDFNDQITGTISAVTGTLEDQYNPESGTVFFDNTLDYLWISGSNDDILDHIAGTRFGRDNKSAIGYINHTSINSTIYFCRVGPNDANFSTNPTYINADGTLRCIQERGDDPFSYITTIGLYDLSGELLAVAKTSRPIEKNPEVDLSISVRIDY